MRGAVLLFDDAQRGVPGEALAQQGAALDPRGRRYRSKRLIALQKRFLPMGEFWSFDDAVDCLRFG